MLLKKRTKPLFKISYSSRNNWKCQKRGALIHVLKVQEPFIASGALCMGIAFHNLIDTMYTNVKKGLMDYSLNWLLDNWEMFYNEETKKAKNKIKDIEEKKKQGIELINGFWEMANKNDWLKTPIMNERFLSFKYKKYDILFKADAVFEHEDKYEIIDWKTGISGYVEHEDNQQMVQYLQCFRREFAIPRMYEGNLIDLTKKKIIATLVFPLERKKIVNKLKRTGLERMQKDVDNIINIVNENGEKIELYKTNPSRDNCLFCNLECKDKFK
jgi:hypothetical protein